VRVGCSCAVKIIKCKRKPSVQDAGKSNLQIMRSVWEEREFTDAEVRCGGKNFRVHRCILSAAAPFFRAVFSGTMQEAITGVLDIDDAPSSAVEAMLRYIYTGTLGDADAKHVLPLAHRYEIDSLVKSCAQKMLDDLNETNIAEIIVQLRKYTCSSQCIAETYHEVQKRLQRNERLLISALAHVHI